MLRSSAFEMRVASNRWWSCAAAALVVLLVGLAWLAGSEKSTEPLQIVSMQSRPAPRNEQQFTITNGAKWQQEFLATPEVLHATGWVSRLDLQRQYRMNGSGNMSCLVAIPRDATVWRIRMDPFKWRGNPNGLLAKIGAWFGVSGLQLSRLGADVRPPILSEPITNKFSPPEPAAEPPPAAAVGDALEVEAR